jgi:hypothetical protein
MFYLFFRKKNNMGESKISSANKPEMGNWGPASLFSLDRSRFSNYVDRKVLIFYNYEVKTAVELLNV